jgi:hypothetical protein
MRRAFLWLTSLLAVYGCSRLDSIPYCCPEQAPETWCSIQPCVALEIAWADVILVQPSSTVLIYFLGILTIGVGLYFLRIREDQQSRLWWGIALLLWGVGALFAGTSYQAFSYEIKCAGREYCTWTSWWEVFYLMLTVESVDAMMMAEAYCCTVGKWRRALSIYGLVNAVLYVIVVLVGAFVPIKFLVSFELLILFTAPTILIFCILNGWRYYKRKDAMDLALLVAWIGLGITIGAYYLYLELGIARELWAQGIWFSENDVLHVGLIIWMIYIALVVADRVEDALADRLEREAGSR